MVLVSESDRYADPRVAVVVVAAVIAILLALSVCSLPRTDGHLSRSRASVRAFRRASPCPATGRTSGACLGFVVDHVVPLCAGGADAPENMQWEPLAESREKDKAEDALCRWIEKACRSEKAARRPHP